MKKVKAQLNMLIQEPTNSSDVANKISQDPVVNIEQETVLICWWRKKDIEYLDVLFKQHALSPDPHYILLPY